MTAASAAGSAAASIAGQLVEQRLNAAALDGVLVEEARVEVADPLLVGARRSACPPAAQRLR